LRRGYNPADLLSAELSRILGIPTYYLLRRIRKTDYQKNKVLDERIRNVQGAFSCPEDLSRKTIVLVDDVMTTGSTIDECSRILKMYDAKKVVCLTIASTNGVA
jgi:ComF family protein